MTPQTLALFDLDHTLLPIDTDHEWIEWLVRKNLAGDPEEIKRKNQELFNNYHQGKLNINDSLDFMLSFLTMHSPMDLAKYHEQYMQEVVRPQIFPAALELVDQHQTQGHLCCLVSATNTFVITPVARAFGFQHIIGTTPEFKEGRYTGKIVGTPSYKEGKITRVAQWLNGMQLGLDDFSDSYFYSDSINDVPLMEKVTHPIATNPQDSLRQLAQQRNWDILDLFS